MSEEYFWMKTVGASFEETHVWGELNVRYVVVYVKWGWQKVTSARTVGRIQDFAGIFAFLKQTLPLGVAL